MKKLSSHLAFFVLILGLVTSISAHSTQPLKKERTLVNLESAIEASKIVVSYRSGVAKVTPFCNEKNCKEVFFKIDEDTIFNRQSNRISPEEIASYSGKGGTVVYDNSNPDILSRVNW